MEFCLIFSLLTALAFNEITAGPPNIGEALRNELNATCVDQYGYDVSDVIYETRTCGIETYGSDVENVDPLLLTDMICNNNKYLSCIKKIKEDILISCLPDDVHGVIKQIIEIDKRNREMLCANNSERVLAMWSSGCEFEAISETHEAESECQNDFESSQPTRLKDFFSYESCRSYEKLYECFNAISTDCPSMVKTLNEYARIITEASLCN